MYLGNQPALSYTSFAKQDFTTSATTSYTLDNPVTNANELALFINFVRQEPTTAYSASGTSLTLTSATSATDDMYCVFLGKAVQTVNPPNSSVGASQIVDASITSGKLASGVLPTNTPAFQARMTSSQFINDVTNAVVQYNDEVFDTDSAYDTSTYRFTVPSGKAGKYFFGAHALLTNIPDKLFSADMQIRKNGTNIAADNLFVSSSTFYNGIFKITTIIDLSVGDYVDVNVLGNTSDSSQLRLYTTSPYQFSGFYGYKILT